MDPEIYCTSFPIVAVDAAWGDRLQELCVRDLVRVRLTHRRQQILKRSKNIIGKIIGKSGRKVVVGAHYDTQLNVPGAWDYAAGCAVLIDMARAARGLDNVLLSVVKNWVYMVRHST